MKVLAYCCLHYGKDYLPYAIKSVYDLVDRFAILYCPHPSHGHRSNLPCPDSRDELRRAAYSFGDLDGKIEWYDGDWHGEGDHRMAVMSVWRGEDFIVPVDSDEVWGDGVLEVALRHAHGRPERDFLKGFVHFWRSFGWCCRDAMGPVRLINPRGSGTEWLPGNGNNYHFGYAQRPEIVRYKWAIHGHKNELRNGWFEDVFMAWPERRADLHPTCVDTWDAEPFDRADLPDFLEEHPFFNLEIVV